MGKAAEAEIFAPLPEYTTTEGGDFYGKSTLPQYFQKRNRPHHAGRGYTNLGSFHQSGRKGKHHPRKGKRIA